MIGSEVASAPRFNFKELLCHYAVSRRGPGQMSAITQVGRQSMRHAGVPELEQNKLVQPSRNTDMYGENWSYREIPPATYTGSERRSGYWFCLK